MTSPIDRDYLLLIDVSSYLHAHFHAQARLVRAKDGLPVGALSGLSWSLMKFLVFERLTTINRRPSHVAVVMDTRGKNFRHELFEGYKAHRDPYPEDLERQIPWIPTLCQAFNAPCIKIEGWEADDVLATYARMGVEAGLQVVIATRDKDLCQCVSESVFLYNSKEDRDPERYDNSDSIKDAKSVRDKWGVWPWQMVDLQAMMGDAVDGIPGVPKIGQKTAAKLLNQFGSLDAILDAADWGPDDFERELEYRAIAENRDLAVLSRELTRLSDTVDVVKGIDEIAYREPSRTALRYLFVDLGLPSLVRRVDNW